MGGSGRIVGTEISDNICESLISGVPAVGGGLRFWILTGSQDTTDCVVKDNLINNNKSKSLNATAYAGGINSSGCIITMTGNTIKNNVKESIIESYGSGMHRGGLNIGVSVIDKNMFIGNHSEGNGISYGGALYLRNSKLEVTNNIIDNNQANYGEGVCLEANTSAQIINNTIISNEAISNGGGIYSDQSTLFLINSILWENSATNGSQISYSSGIIYVRYSDVEGGYTGLGNIDSYPLFSDTLLHLSDSSTCIGAGIDSIEINGSWYYAP